MFEQLQEILGISVPVQFEPILIVICALLLLFQLAFFAEILKLLILRR